MVGAMTTYCVTKPFAVSITDHGENVVHSFAAGDVIDTQALPARVAANVPPYAVEPHDEDDGQADDDDPAPTDTEES